MSNWFKRKMQGITTPSEEKKDIPDGMWHKTPSGQVITESELKENMYVSPEDGHHVRIGSEEYFQLFFDEGKYEELDKDLKAVDTLKFEDTKKYSERLEAARKKTGLNDAIRVGVGNMNEQPMVIACMDFSFIGGSMGVVMGEKIVRGIQRAIEQSIPFMIISKSGGARMMESAFSLMQMAKVAAKLNELSEAGLPYISYLTDPTTGGVTASFAMLGDINVAEPGALIGFAGPRVIKETIGKDLPEGFQTSEFLLEQGFLDFIIDRRNAKSTLTQFMKFVMPQEIKA